MIRALTDGVVFAIHVAVWRKDDSATTEWVPRPDGRPVAAPGPIGHGWWVLREGPALGWRLVALGHVVVVEQRVRQVAEGANLVVGHALSKTLVVFGKMGHSTDVEAGGGLPY